MHFSDPTETRSLFRHHVVIRRQKILGKPAFHARSRFVAQRAARRIQSMRDTVDEPMFPAAAPHPATAVRKIATRTRAYSPQNIVMRIAYTVRRNKARFP
jgi:hypothetical protein